MKRVLLLVALVACEKERGAHVHAPPAKVGDRTHYQARNDGHFTDVDGVEHGKHGETSLILEVLAATNGHADRMRITVDRDDQVFDGKPTPTLAGTYELNAAGELSRPGGKPLTDYERGYFRNWHIATDLSTIANHEFRAGDTWHPSDDEAIALGTAKATWPWIFHVTQADADEIVLAADYDDGKPPQEVVHGTTTITLTSGAHTHVSDMTVRRGDQVVGGAHSTYVLRPQR